MTTRKTIPKATVIQVLTEAGYRCAVPTCRQILAIDIHHMVEVSEGGGNDQQNLLPLCPTCHALYHRGTISSDAIYAWKATIVSLSQAFDTQSIDDLLFLANSHVANHLHVSGDGVAKFSRLIGAGLATFDVYMRNGPIVLYRIGLTPKGAQLIQAWQSGDRELLTKMMGG
jgi:HNH endonuclease